MIIAIDFDGTCVTHEYPNIGQSVNAEPVLKKLVESGNQLMLWTMRSGKELDEAVNWFKEREIPLWGVNKNPGQNWTSSPKQYAHVYIDDTALGCPLVYRPSVSNRPFADWARIEKMLDAMGAL